MTIKEIAELCHVSTRTLRYYEEIGLIQSERRANNYRVYHFDVVARIEMIVMLKKTGLQLEEIKRELNDSGRMEALFRRQRQLLEEEKEKLNRSIRFIDAQQSMIDEFKAHGMNQLYVEERSAETYEVIKRIDKRETAVILEYEDVQMAIDSCVDPTVYIVKELPEKRNRRVAAMFLSGEHRIRHRQRTFIDALKANGLNCKFLIHSKSCCLIGMDDVYFMWCEVDGQNMTE